MKIISVKDMKAKLFLQPTFQRSVHDATRSFEVIVNEPDNMISKFPDDFRLYQIGEFDQDSGVITETNPPLDLGAASEFKKRPPLQNAVPL